MDVVANAIMLQNVADLTEVLNSMAEDGFTITPELAFAVVGWGNIADISVLMTG